MVQVWDITGGSWEGVELGGLQVAVLKASPENLAAPDAQADEAVVYLPQAAGPSQRGALVAWLKSREPELKRVSLRTRVLPVAIRSHTGATTFTAGEHIALRVISAGNCENRVCGEDLWYAPRDSTLAFTVAVNAGSQVHEPLLQLKWSDHGKRSAFLARFGEAEAARNLFVQSSDWCGPTGRLF